MATTAAPKYPYPSSLNVANFITLQLTHDNYLLWKTQITSLIESQDLFGFLDGTIVQPKPTIDDTNNGGSSSKPNPDYVAWKKSDRLLRGWIAGSLSVEVLSVVVGKESSAEVWNTLTTAFAHKSKERQILLTRKLQTYRKKQKSLTEYITGFKNICDEMAAIGKPLDDEDKVYWLVSGLGAGYEAFTTSMLKPPVPSYLEAMSLLQGHETMKELHAVPSG